MINKGILYGLVAAALAGALPTYAAENPAEIKARELEARQAELERQREEMMASIERSRIEAERAAEEARIKAENLRAEAERMRVQADEMMREAGTEQREQLREIERSRRELSRTHRELQRASQEIARAHRELALVEDHRLRTRVINLGDRAMIGVVLGEETEEGIKVIGISPDGPAERAGLKAGDVIVSLRGESLGEGRSAREVIFEVMSDIGDGEEISVSVVRDGERHNFMLTPEKREPASWASYIRLPEPVVAPGAPRPPDAAHPAQPPHPAMPVLPETIVIPGVDTAAVVAQAEAIAGELESFRIMVESGDGIPLGYQYDYDFGDFDFTFDTEAYSDLATMALADTGSMFSAAAMFGIRFTELNQGLGSYFGTDRGVLVLDAPEDNPLLLEAGDVVLGIGDSDVGEISDVVRALRSREAGDQFNIAIKRDQRDQSLAVTMPERRFGLVEKMLFGDPAHHGHGKVIPD